MLHRPSLNKRVKLDNMRRLEVLLRWEVKEMIDLLRRLLDLLEQEQKKSDPKDPCVQLPSGIWMRKDQLKK